MKYKKITKKKKKIKKTKLKENIGKSKELRESLKSPDLLNDQVFQKESPLSKTVY